MLLPLGLAIGLALTTTFGGRDGLRALAQVFSGPTAPGGHGQADEPGLESAKAVPAIPLPPRHHARPSTPAIRGTSAAPSTRTPAHRPSTTPTTTPVHHPTGGGGTGSGGGTSSTPAPPPSSPPPPQHSAVHNTGQKVADQTKQLPPPVGPVAGNAVQTVVDLIP